MIYQLRITLSRINPPIWRQVLIPTKHSLSKTHKVIQAAMGWKGYHLHQFRTKNLPNQKPVYYGEPDIESSDNLIDDKKVKLSDVLKKENEVIIYDYDFGDGWQHEIILEKILDRSDQTHPICIGGEGACPPEDVGGIPGYYDFLEAIGDPKHDEHEHLMAWSGGRFDPEKFNMTAVNKKLKAL